mgnify:CR=1 FL=1
MMTLAKNKPVLMDDLDIKLLLLEAHHKGHHEMLYIVPFVAKILESCAKSKVSIHFNFRCRITGKIDFDSVIRVSFFILVFNRS